MRALLTLLIRLFPRGFKRQFGADLEEQVVTDYARETARGRLRGLGFAVLTSADLVRSAIAERWSPTWARRDDTNDGGGMGMGIGRWIADLRQATRSLRRSPGYSVVTVVTLGLAIGANASIFSVVDTVLLDPLPFAEQEELVSIRASAPGSDLPEEFGPSAEFYIQYREQSQLLEELGAINGVFTSTLRVGDRVERIAMTALTAPTLHLLGVEPILGRLPVEADDDRTIVISHALWTTWFRADPSVIGRSYYAAGADREVIGVMPSDFWFPDDRTLLWIPNVIREEDVTPGRFGITLVGRLTPGATHEELTAELGRLARRLPERFGGSANYARMIEQHRPIVRSLDEELLDVSRPLWVLLGSVGLVLLIACANVTNLVLVRAEQRQRDLAVRRALGADRRQLVRTQLAEAVVLAGLAGALAVGLAWVGTPLFLRAAPPDIPRLADVSISGATLLFTLALAAGAALLCGFAPALRSSTHDATRIREGGRGSTSRRTWARDVLVAGQTAMALVLLTGSALLVRSFVELRNVDPGYDLDDLFTFQIAPEEEGLTGAEAYARFHMELMDRIAAMPGVASVGVVENVPLNESVATQRFLTEETASDTDGGTLIGRTWAGGDYFATMGIDVLEGRTFERADHVSRLGNVVVSRAAADLLWPGESALGRRLQVRDSGTWETVVGVVEDVLQGGFRDDPQPLVYHALLGQGPDPREVSSPAYVVKTERADVIAPDIRAMVREVAPSAPMYRVFTMAGLARDSMVELSFTTLTLAIAAGLALMLGAIGLFGVLSYVVAQRTQEIGVRMALGAEASRVRRLVVAQGVRVVAVGIVLGLAAAAALTRVLGRLLYGVEAADPATFAATSVAMIFVGLLASYVPAWRASNVDPIRSLRAD